MRRANDIADLKNTSDDAITNYLNSLKFKQSHSLTDVRLALGYSAFLVAAACFLWDYKFGFESTKYYTAAAVAIYTVLNGLLTLWIWGKEKGTVYVGTAPSGETVCVFLRPSAATMSWLLPYVHSFSCRLPQLNPNLDINSNLHQEKCAGLQCRSHNHSQKVHKPAENNNTLASLHRVV